MCIITIIILLLSQTPLLWHFALRAADKFHSKYARWPGSGAMMYHNNNNNNSQQQSVGGKVMGVCLIVVIGYYYFMILCIVKLERKVNSFVLYIFM